MSNIKFHVDEEKCLSYDRLLVSECAPEIIQVYYSGSPGQYVPEVVKVKINFQSGYTVTKYVPVKDLNYRYLHRVEPMVSCPGSRQKGLFDEYLTCLLRGAIIDQNSASPSGVYFNKYGWNQLPDGGYVFLFGKKVIGKCEQPYCVAPELPSFKHQKDGRALCKLTDALYGSHAIASEMAAYIALTTLRSLIIESGVNVQAAGYIYGAQGVGKSTLAKRMASYIKEEDEVRPANFFDASSTNAALRDAMVTYHDLPVIVDDLCFSAGRQTERKRIETAAQLLRQAANDTMITKMSYDRQKINMYCGAGVIITAEFTLENASDITRCIMFPMKETPELDERIQPELVCEAMLGLAEWFQINGENQLEKLKQYIIDYYSDDTEIDNRMRTNYAALCWSLNCLMLAAEKQGISQSITKAVKKNYHIAERDALALQKDLLEQIERSKPKGNIAYILYEAYDEGLFRMAKKVEKLEVKDGIIWKDDFCLRKAPLENYIRKQPGYHDYTITKITRYLKDIGALYTNESGSDQVHISKDAPRVYRMKVNVLKENSEKY